MRTEELITKLRKNIIEQIGLKYLTPKSNTAIGLSRAEVLRDLKIKFDIDEDGLKDDEIIDPYEVILWDERSWVVISYAQNKYHRQIVVYLRLGLDGTVEWSFFEGRGETTIKQMNNRWAEGTAHKLQNLTPPTHRTLNFSRRGFLN